MNCDQLKSFIERVLKEVGLYDQKALMLLLGTAAQESHLGTYIRQINGPALGIFQMEPATFNDITDNFLNYKRHLKERIIKVCNVQSLQSADLEFNLALAVCFARLQYYRRPEPLPETVEQMAAYWKQWYNTPLGKGTEKEFIQNYQRFINCNTNQKQKTHV